jgi:hypothetical protein
LIFILFLIFVVILLIVNVVGRVSEACHLSSMLLRGAIHALSIVRLLRECLSMLRSIFSSLQ